jgi:hemerythrin-like domain-containing protein
MFFSSQLLESIKTDHRKLRAELALLRETDISQIDRQLCFGRFLPVFISHTHREEKVVYNFMKAQDDENLNFMAYEGETKHAILDQLIEDMLSENLTNQEWSASAKVLSDIVGQHLDEEENEVFPYLKRHLDSTIDAELCLRYESQDQDSNAFNYDEEFLSETSRWS